MVSSQKKIELETRKPFEESLHGILYDIFRQAGVNIPVGSIDRFRGTVKKLAILIATETKLVTLKEVSDLQERVKGAIKDLSELHDLLDDRVQTLEARQVLREDHPEAAAKIPIDPFTNIPVDPVKQKS